MSTYFKALGPFDKATHAIIGCLNSALEGHGSITVKASKKGISIRLRSMVLAEGKTPEEFKRNFEAAMETAKKSKA